MTTGYKARVVRRLDASLRRLSAIHFFMLCCVVAAVGRLLAGVQSSVCGGAAVLGSSGVDHLPVVRVEATSGTGVRRVRTPRPGGWCSCRLVMSA